MASAGEITPGMLGERVEGDGRFDRDLVPQSGKGGAGRANLRAAPESGAKAGTGKQQVSLH